MISILTRDFTITALPRYKSLVNGNADGIFHLALSTTAGNKAEAMEAALLQHCKPQANYQAHVFHSRPQYKSQSHYPHTGCSLLPLGPTIPIPTKTKSTFSCNKRKKLDVLAGVAQQYGDFDCRALDRLTLQHADKQDYVVKLHALQTLLRKPYLPMHDHRVRLSFLRNSCCGPINISARGIIPLLARFAAYRLFFAIWSTALTARSASLDFYYVLR
jgi:hypothetical protein